MSNFVVVDPPSVVLPAPVFLSAHRWADGVLGRDLEIGPYDVATRPDWCGAERQVDRVMQRRKGSTRCVMIQVSRRDGGAVVDWRDLQQIKNLVCGAEWEAVEIFPAESRLKDPSNARYLWCTSLPLPFGLPGGRNVVAARHAIAPQRPFPGGGGS